MYKSLLFANLFNISSDKSEWGRWLVNFWLAEVVLWQLFLFLWVSNIKCHTLFYISNPHISAWS